MSPTQCAVVGQENDCVGNGMKKTDTSILHNHGAIIDGCGTASGVLCLLLLSPL